MKNSFPDEDSEKEGWGGFSSDLRKSLQLEGSETYDSAEKPKGRRKLRVNGSRQLPKSTNTDFINTDNALSNLNYYNQAQIHGIGEE